MWESFGGRVTKPSMDSPYSPLVERREFLEVSSRLASCLRVWGDRDGFIIRRFLSIFNGSSIETVHFRKMTAMASDGPSSHAVIEQVLLWLLQLEKGVRGDYLRNKSWELIAYLLFLAEATFEFSADYVKKRYCHRSLLSWLFVVVFSISLSTANTWTFFSPSFQFW